ncbi:hypothetical protein CS022_05190 [Veronia nyctiphanis]|uniref:Uncharacterized protein n=1 Tax=Veronia nyctiphanis TaxID=1278244 RepID=A0A4Q0YS57_9GAMM|nr:hypothetical protein [Veronia nyctiphanis]RXJ74040.1 hypothetical protein CS022_05190 [Veronia nyctiphanis]
MNKVRVLFLLAVAAIFTGCTSIPNAPISTEKATYSTSEKSIVFGKLTVKNENATSFQPEVWNLKGSSNGEQFTYSVRNNLIADHGEEGREYFFSFEAPGGQAQLEELTLHAGMSLLISANGALALQKTIDVEKNKVIYIGDITATIVEKKDNEKSVGPAIPLIDQRVAGFSNGTFVVDVKDNFDQDVALLKKTYPAMENLTFTKSVMSKPAVYR